MLIRDSLRRLLQFQIGVLIPDFVTGRAGRPVYSQAGMLALLRQAEAGTIGKGILLPYVPLGRFAGLHPAERCAS